RAFARATGLSPVSVAPPVRGGLGVAVGTEQLQVLQAVVETVAVAVVQLHGQRLAAPFRDPTALAAILLEPGLDQALLEPVATALLACDQQRIKIHAPRSEEHTSELQSRENLVCRHLL